MSGPILLLFDETGALRTTSADIADRTGLDAAYFVQGQALGVLRPLLEQARTDRTTTLIPLADSGTCLSLELPEAGHEAKSRFLATMSHELRTPLNVVIGFADALTRDTSAAPAQIAEFAGAIHQAGQELLGLVNTLIDVARIEQGRFTLQTDTIDIAHLVNSCLTAAQDQARRMRVALSADVTVRGWYLRADERRIRQVLGQLLSNALAFTREGGRVSVTADLVGGETLVFRVTDTGIGIAPEQIAQAFTPFHQADGSLSRRTPGLGLGLYLSRALIEAHGGTLDLESTLGSHTEVTITLPHQRLIEPQASAALLQEIP